MDMDVVGNKERLLKGILDGETTTNIEPASREERLLKAILENGGGGGGGGATSVTLAASGDNLSGDISLADLKTALSNGVVLLSFPTNGDADERVVAEYTDDSTNGLRIGVFSEDEYIVYSVVDDGSNGITLTVVSEKGLGDLIVTLTAEGTVTDRYIPDKTWSQINNALTAGHQVTFKAPGNVRQYVVGAGKISPTVWGTIAGSCTGGASAINIYISSYSIQKNTDADTCYVDKIRQATI